MPKNLMGSKSNAFSCTFISKSNKAKTPVWCLLCVLWWSSPCKQQCQQMSLPDFGNLKAFSRSYDIPPWGHKHLKSAQNCWSNVANLQLLPQVAASPQRFLFLDFWGVQLVGPLIHSSQYVHYLGHQAQVHHSQYLEEGVGAMHLQLPKHCWCQLQVLILLQVQSLCSYMPQMPLQILQNGQH